MEIKSSSANKLYIRALRELINYPEYESSPRGMKIHENINTTLILTNPRDRLVTLPSREMSFRYLAGELAFYFSMSDELDFISRYSKFWNKCSDDGETVNSCYGKKLMSRFLYDDQPFNGSQIGYAIKQLEKDKDSRKAISLIYTPVNTDLDTKDNPCTMYLQFMIRNNELNLVVNMRSNDIWFGLPYDLAFFTIMQELVFTELKKSVYPDLELGKYFHNAGSFHLYEKDFAKAEKVVTEDINSYVFEKQAFSMSSMTEQTLEEMCTGFLPFERYKRTGKEEKNISEIEDPFTRELCLMLL